MALRRLEIHRLAIFVFVLLSSSSSSSSRLPFYNHFKVKMTCDLET